MTETPNNSDNGEQWEKKTQKQMARDRYRFGGERYGFRGRSNCGPDDWIPQVSGLYAFPQGDMQNPEPPKE